MFVGEAPGKNEALTGKPFCGAAGKILDELLATVGINRADIYITNIVKDRPPENRDPSPAEIESYGPFLDRQIEIIRPKVIATLGRYSMVYIMNRLGLGSELVPISRPTARNTGRSPTAPRSRSSPSTIRPSPFITLLARHIKSRFPDFQKISIISSP